MFKKWFSASALLLALTLIFGGGLTAAQNRDGPKDVPYIYAIYPTCQSPNCVMRSMWVMWHAPPKAPDSYRIQWTTTGKWRSIKKPNNEKAGTATVSGTRLGYCIRGLKLKYGETLKVRVRARYDGKKNGDWNCCLRFTYG